MKNSVAVFTRSVVGTSRDIFSVDLGHEIALRDTEQIVVLLDCQTDSTS